jgi:prepilin-type N-terminal cleavage/methylation domain-containing protein
MRTRTKKRLGSLRPGSPRRRGGFTLVELLVVITIIGMLMALVFPAIGAVLDTVKANQCANTLKTIGTAISTYQAQRSGKWPVVSSKPVDCKPAEVPVRRKGAQTRAIPEAGYSWLVKLLPYIGSQNMYNDIASASDNFKAPAFDMQVSTQHASGAKRHLSTVNPEKIFKCASYESKAQVEMTSEAPEYNSYTDTGSGFAVGITNYVALSATHLSAVIQGQSRGRGPAAPPKPNGVMVYRAMDQGVSKVSDGESQTIVAVETREPNYASWFDGTTAWVVAHHPSTPEPELRIEGNKAKLRCDGACRHSMNVGPDSNGLGPKYRETWAGQMAWQFGPSSSHGGGSVNHLFADKHVQALNPQVDASVYMWLVTRDGGEVVEGGY